MKKILLLLLASAAVLKAHSQSPSVMTTTKTFSITAILDLTKSSNGTLYTFSTTTDFDNGIDRQFDITIKSNKPWKLNVTASSPQFASSSSTTMPVSVIQAKRSTDVSYSNIPYVLTGSRGKYTYRFHMRANPGYAYDPGVYSNVDINFVVTEQ